MPDSILLDEPVRLLTDDMRSSVQAYSLLAVIGNGCNRLSEIAGRLNKPATQLSKPLANLIDLGYIRKENPFNENEKSSKKSLYKINDPFFSFYFRYILPNKSRIELGLKKQVMKNIKESISHFIGQFWEHLSCNSVPFTNIEGINWDIAKRWWGKDNEGNVQEVDIISESFDKKSLLIGEAKWEEKTDMEKLGNELTKKINNLPFIKKYKKIIKAYWLKHPPMDRAGYNIFSPADVLSVLR